MDGWMDELRSDRVFDGIRRVSLMKRMRFLERVSPLVIGLLGIYVVDVAGNNVCRVYIYSEKI